MSLSSSPRENTDAVPALPTQTDFYSILHSNMSVERPLASAYVKLQTLQFLESLIVTTGKYKVENPRGHLRALRLNLLPSHFLSVPR